MKILIKEWATYKPGLGADGVAGEAHADRFGLVEGDWLGDPCLAFYV